MKIVEYMVLSDVRNSDQELRTEDGELATAVYMSGIIDEALTEGWQPFGPPVIDRDWFAQAMVKYDQ